MFLAKWSGESLYLYRIVLRTLLLTSSSSEPFNPYKPNILITFLMWHPMWNDSTWSVWYTQSKSMRHLIKALKVRFWPLKAISSSLFSLNTIVGYIWALFSSFSEFCLFKFFLFFLVPLFFSIYSSFVCVWFYCIFIRLILLVFMMMVWCCYCWIYVELETSGTLTNFGRIFWVSKNIHPIMGVNSSNRLMQMIQHAKN